MRTRGRHILAAALAVVSLLMLFAAPAAAAERYCFQRKSIKILKDITGLLKKENLKESLSRQKKIAADLEKIRKVSESDYAIAAAIMRGPGRTALSSAPAAQPGEAIRKTTPKPAR